MTKFVLVKNMTDRVILGNPFLCLLYPFITDNEGITAHPFNQPVKFEFVRSPAPWEIKSLQKASIAKTLSILTTYNQAQNLDSAKTIDCPFSHNRLSSCIHYKYICIPASISFKRKRIFNQPLKILFHSKLSWQEKATMSSPAEKKGKGKVPARDYPQDKRLPVMGQSFEKHEGASSTSHRGATSLQPMYPEMVTYSSGFMAITLEKVRNRTLQFRGGIYTKLPHSTKFSSCSNSWSETWLELLDDVWMFRTFAEGVTGSFFTSSSSFWATTSKAVVSLE